MAKTILEQLLGLLSPEERASVQSKIDANPRLAVQDRRQEELFSIYTGETGLDTGAGAGAGAGGDDQAEAERARQAEAERARQSAQSTEAERAKAAEAERARAAATAAAADNPVLAKLNELSTRLDARLSEIEKKFVPVDKLADYEEQFIAKSVKISDDLAKIRESHRREFGEELDEAKFNEFVQGRRLPDQMAADGKTVARKGAFLDKTLKDAHDLFVGERRTQKKIEQGVDEQLKQRRSGQEAPGQTQAASLAPAQAILKKARETGKAAGKSNAMAAAERLAAIERQKEEAGVGVVQ